MKIGPSPTPLMHEYTGVQDPSRLKQLAWKSKDFIAQIGRLTGYVLEDKGIPGCAAYSAKYPAPTVSRLHVQVLFLLERSMICLWFLTSDPFCL